jgi:hypothetical protein
LADPLQSARQKLAWGKKRIKDLDAELRAFNDTHPYERVIEPNPEAFGQVHLKVKLTKAIPESIPLIVGDAACNLRDALDHAVYGVAAAKGGSPKEAYFPFARNSDSFEKNLKGRCRDVPHEIYPIFRALKPYQGGNDFLWSLNQVCVGNKHKIVAPMGNGALLNKVQVTGVGFAINRDPQWDHAKNEMIFLTARTDANFHHELNFTFFVAFHNVPVIEGMPVDTVLDKMAGMVEGILGIIEAEATRLGLFVS